MSIIFRHMAQTRSGDQIAGGIKRKGSAKIGAYHGYWSILGAKPNSPKAIMKVIRGGLPYATIKLLQDTLELNRYQIATVLQMSSRTLERRKKSGKLDSIESDRALRLFRVFWRARELYEGDQEAALKWLKRKNAALEGLAPEEMIETESGAVLVENLIGRLENGVFS
jgi:putative toxin-antitoxin system antitoxin component (TIGR02293 family)